MSRYDYIYVNSSHFKNLTDSEMSDIEGLEFQTKDLQREFLQYDISADGILCYQDFHYELVDNKEDGLFTKSMRRVYDGVVKETFTGEVVFYGKPYESMYIFLARFTNGKLDYIRLLNKSLPVEQLNIK